jgi:hypothetical protein
LRTSRQQHRVDRPGQCSPENYILLSIAVDPERGPLITEAFELFATGQYSGKQVYERITAAGLTSRGSRRTPARPIGLNTLYRILADRYYLGFVEYQGEEFPGRHQPLVTPEVFDRVQRVLALRGGGGTRQRQHDHWLKGLIFCGRCHKRLIVMPGKGNGGTYFYFMCRGRQARSCELPYLKVQAVEKIIEQHYATVRLSNQFRDDVRRQLDDTVLTELASIEALRKRLTAWMSWKPRKNTTSIWWANQAGPKPRSKRNWRLSPVNERRSKDSWLTPLPSSTPAAVLLERPGATA